MVLRPGLCWNIILEPRLAKTGLAPGPKVTRWGLDNDPGGREVSGSAGRYASPLRAPSCNQDQRCRKRLSGGLCACRPNGTASSYTPTALSSRAPARPVLEDLEPRLAKTRTSPQRRGLSHSGGGSGIRVERTPSAAAIKRFKDNLCRTDPQWWTHTRLSATRDDRACDRAPGALVARCGAFADVRTTRAHAATPYASPLLFARIASNSVHVCGRGEQGG